PELPDWRPEPSPYAPTERPPAIPGEGPVSPYAPTELPTPSRAPTEPVTPSRAPTEPAPAPAPEPVADPRARRAADDQRRGGRGAPRPQTPEEARALDIFESLAETTGEGVRALGRSVEAEYLDVPEAPTPARRRGDPNPPDRTRVSPNVAADLRARARAAA